MSEATIARAEDDTLAEILAWVQEVVEGRGESASQMIVTVVLGCVPYVGQAVDAYNILRSLYALLKDVEDTDRWIDLVLSLIALVPLFGDALKNVFKGLRGGKSMGRILDSLPATVRGNIEQWFRALNWAAYTRELSQSVDSLLSGLIDVLDTHVTKWVMGRQGVQRLVAQLNALKRMARRKIEEAMERLRLAHQQSIAQPLPSTSAHVPAAPPQTPRRATPGSQASGNVPTTTRGTPTARTGQANGTQRQSQRANQTRHQTGVSGEHIADYYYVKRQRSRKKVSHRGALYEMSTRGHNGIDHVWHGARLPHNYRVSDTKGTVGAFHKLETAQAVFQALRYGIDAYLGEDEEARARGAVNSRATRSGRQMSHRWVAANIDGTNLLQSSRTELVPAIRAWERAAFQLGSDTSFQDGELKTRLVRCPYDRSIITVVGPNHNKHQAAAGAVAPVCLKPVASHQIATEFVLPTDMLRE